jgi:hypothetical protein
MSQLFGTFSLVEVQGFCRILPDFLGLEQLLRPLNLLITKGFRFSQPALDRGFQTRLLLWGHTIPSPVCLIVLLYLASKGISLFHHSRQRIFEMPSLRGEAFDLRYENEMKKGSAFILSPE